MNKVIQPISITRKVLVLESVQFLFNVSTHSSIYKMNNMTQTWFILRNL